MPISTQVTPALHPDNIKSIEGLDERTRPYIAPVETAMSEAYEAIDAIAKARVAVAKNGAWSEGQKVLHVAQFAEKQEQKVLRRVDSTLANLAKSIKATDEMLQGPLEQQAGIGSINEEIRRHVKGLSLQERHKFLEAANAAGDDKTLLAVLGAPDYLSGMAAPEHAGYLRLFHERRQPEAAARLKVMKQAHAMLEDRAPLIFPGVEKAIGTSWAKIQKLRSAHTEAEKALVMNDTSNDLV